MRLTLTVLVGAAGAALASAATAGANVQVSQSGWAWGNPAPQGNTVRAMEFVSGRGYAVGDAGTALRTDDGGATWTGLATGTAGDLDRLQVVTPDTLVVQGGDGCVLRRSDDGGRTFRRVYVLAERNCPNKVQAASFVDPQVGYVLLRDGNVLRTADAGDTFAKQTAVPGTAASTGGGSDAPVELAFTSADRGLAFTTAGGASRLYETTDQGVSWKPLDLPSARISRVTFLDAQTAYAVGSNTLLRTTDGGRTWTRRAAGDGQELTSIRCATTDTCLLTVAAGDRLLRTTDGGATATPITAATPALHAAAFASPSRVVAAGADGATVVSDDGGLNYTPVGGDVGGAYTALRAGPAAPTAFALGLKGQLARTTDGGASWKALAVPTAADVADVSFASGDVGYALDAAGGLFKTANAGQSWQTLEPGTTERPLAVASAGGGVVLLAGPVGVRRQVGGGRFDAVADRDVARATLSGFDAAPGAIAVFGPRAVAVSTDRGASWRNVTLPNPTRARRNPLRVRDADFTAASRGYLLDTSGRLWQTANGGRRWTELGATGVSTATSVSFGSATRGFLVAARYPADPQSAFVLRTSDGGRSWRPQSLAVGQLPPGGVVATSAGQAFALALLPGSSQAVADRLFATATGGDAGQAARLSISTPTRRLTRAALRRARFRVTVHGTLEGAQGGEQVVVSQRAAKGGRWASQVVTAGANGGSFTATFHVTGSSFVVAQWPGDSGRTGAGTPVLGISVR